MRFLFWWLFQNQQASSQMLNCSQQGRMTGEIKIGMDDNLTSISAWSLTQILDSHIGGVSNT
jgi:hypothetical protein